MLLNRLRDAMAWRWYLVTRKRFLRRTFRNGDELVRSYMTKSPCDQAICRDGRIIRHPAGRSGLVQMILEVWFEQTYTAMFPRLKAGDTVVDAGANIGLFSLWVARNHPGCQVFAFEPFEENYRLLQDNLASARASNVKMFRLGLAGEAGRAAMIDGGSRSQDHRLAAVQAAEASDLAVRTISFADLFAMTGTRTIALFKCDIEGAEYALFERAESDHLRRVLHYAIEYHDNIYPGTLNLLRERLEATHTVTTRPSPAGGYGMIYATMKPL